jgi:hypothetical protein
VARAGTTPKPGSVIIRELSAAGMFERAPAVFLALISSSVFFNPVSTLIARYRRTYLTLAGGNKPSRAPAAHA